MHHRSFSKKHKKTNSACFWVLFWGSFSTLTTVDSIFFKNPAPPGAEVKQLRLGLPMRSFFCASRHGRHENQKMAGKSPNENTGSFLPRILPCFGWENKNLPQQKIWWEDIGWHHPLPRFVFNDLFWQLCPPFCVASPPSPTLVTFSPVEMEPRRFFVEAEKTNKKTIGYSD